MTCYGFVASAFKLVRRNFRDSWQLLQRNGMLSTAFFGWKRVRPMEKRRRPKPTDKQGGEQPLSFDPTTPPAPVDVHGFSRRAGEIIARAARTLLRLSTGKSARTT